MNGRLYLIEDVQEKFVIVGDFSLLLLQISLKLKVEMFQNLFDLFQALVVCNIVWIIISKVITSQKVRQAFMILCENQSKNKLKLLNLIVCIETH